MHNSFTNLLKEDYMVWEYVSIIVCSKTQKKEAELSSRSSFYIIIGWVLGIGLDKEFMTQSSKVIAAKPKIKWNLIKLKSSAEQRKLSSE